jgi:2-polyprenyl-6-methoxyphenol hydroxylase-like FAD-dependent oxidoreductase
MQTTLTTDVLIVGAGPTGLALACQFIRYGLDFVIIDKKETTTPFSKAIGVQARTLEIYEQIGLADRLVELGTITKGVRLLEGGEERAQVELTKLGQGMSPYPYLLIVEQGKHESLLYEHIKTHGRDVQWQATLESFSQNESGVTANVVYANGEKQTIVAQYLVAADGARSLVRHELGMTFEGSTLERMFYVADVQLAWQYAHDILTVTLGRDRSTAFFPMPGRDRYRIVGVFPENTDKKEGEVLYEEIEQQILEDTELKLDIYKVHWFSTYQIHSRRVNKFSEGRCFLVGDSAHIHSPAGAQGMNTGIQDGYNLAWKLALVLQGKLNEKVLATYNEERIEIAKRLLETTDRMFDLLMNPAWLLAFVRQYVFPHVANFVVGLDSVNQFIFPLISQTGIHYRHRTLSLDEGEHFNVQPGDRMPYFLLDRQSIYDRLHSPSFHLLNFTKDSKPQNAKSEIEPDYAGVVDYYQLPLTAAVSEHFGTTEPFTVLLRPDNHVAFVSFDNSFEHLKNYFELIGIGPE